MNNLDNTPVLRFNKNTLEDVRKEFGLEKPEMIKQSLEVFDQWLEKQHHILKKDFSKEFKERLLINCKGSVERAKEKMDKLCTIKTVLPKYFETLDVITDYEPYKGGLVDALLPSMTAKNERILFLKNVPFKTSDMMGYYRRFVKILEYTKKYDYSTGVHIVLDYTETNILEFAAKLNPIDIIDCASICIDAYAMRLKSIHLITPSKMVDVMVLILKQALSAKLGQRIYIHQTLETLFKVFPKEIMPKEYGGQEKSLQELNDILTKELASKEFVNYLKDMFNAVTDERLRQRDSCNAYCTSMIGSFRSLSVD